MVLTTDLTQVVSDSYNRRLRRHCSGMLICHQVASGGEWQRGCSHAMRWVQDTSWEVLWSCAVMFVGAISFGYIIGNGTFV